LVKGWEGLGGGRAGFGRESRRTSEGSEVLSCRAGEKAMVSEPVSEKRGGSCKKEKVRRNATGGGSKMQPGSVPRRKLRCSSPQDMGS